MRGDDDAVDDRWADTGEWEVLSRVPPLVYPDVGAPELWGAPDDDLGEDVRARYVARVRKAMRDEDGNLAWPYGIAITYRIRRGSQSPGLWAMTVRARPSASWSPTAVDTVDGMWLTRSVLEGFNSARLAVWGTPGTLAQLHAPPHAGGLSSPLSWAWLRLVVGSPHGDVDDGDLDARWTSHAVLGPSALTQPLVLAGPVPVGWP